MNTASATISDFLLLGDVDVETGSHYEVHAGLEPGDPPVSAS